MTVFTRLAVCPAGVTAIVSETPAPNILKDRRVGIPQNSFERIVLQCRLYGQDAGIKQRLKLRIEVVESCDLREVGERKPVRGIPSEAVALASAAISDVL